jgi:hypothetical protein
MMLALLSLAEASSIAYAASVSSFWGLGKAGLITTIIVSVILIATVAWLVNGTKKRD